MHSVVYCALRFYIKQLQIGYRPAPDQFLTVCMLHRVPGLWGVLDSICLTRLQSGSLRLSYTGIQYTVYSIQCTVFSVQYSVYSIQCTVFSVQYSPEYYTSIQYTVYSIHPTCDWFIRA